MQKSPKLHLLTVEIPHFRVLKNVRVDFKKDFSPRIYPLSSKNGGGKSTLLQLIFALLRGDKPLASLLSKVSINPGILAKFDFLDGDRQVELEFAKIPNATGIRLFNFADGTSLALTGSADRDFLQELSQRTYMAAPLNYNFLPYWEKSAGEMLDAGFLDLNAVTGNLQHLSPNEAKITLLRNWIPTLPKGAIILLDEIDSGLDADNQYLLAEDLQNLESSHQYIVSTHSYEMCQALTPSHVKCI